MKKTLLTLLIALCTLFTACDMGSVGQTSSPSSSISSTDSSSEEESSSSPSGGNEGGGEQSPEQNPGGNGGGNENEGGTENPPETGDCQIDHVDVNDDGICDECDTTVLLTFDFFSINDLHGKFNTTANYNGVNKMSTYLRQAKQKNPNALLLSSGDTWQGCYESNLTQGAILTEWMNELGFTAMTLGNHEYDWGEQPIIHNADLAEFPLLAINVYDKTTGRLAEYCQPSIMVEKNGARIGIIGAQGDVASDIAPEHIQNVEFKTGSELTSLVKAEANRLRAAGADCIVYSMHDGTSYDYSYASSDIHDHYDESLSQGYVDIVFEAHSHARYALKDTYGVYHLQAGGDNQYGLSHAEIQMNIANESVNVKKAEVVYHSTYSSLAGDPTIDNLLSKYQSQIAPGLEELGDNDIERDSEDILSLASQAYYTAGAKKWSDKNIVLGGGYIGVRFPYKLSKGKILYGDLLNVLPFDNEVQLCTVNGSDLQKYFINKSNYRNYYSAYGESIKSSPVATQTYYIVIDSYCASSSVNYAKSLKVVETYAPKIYARDLLAELIKEGILSAVRKITIPEAQAIGNALAAGATTDDAYRIEGRIVGIESPEKYGNMTIEDDNGNQLYIYGTYDAAGNRYGYMENPPQVGETVVLQGKIMNYKTNAGTLKVEMINATIIE